MFELLAEGPNPRQRWRIELRPGESLELGRDPQADLPVPWDPHVSRRHVWLNILNDGIEVENLSATNPLLFDGRTVQSCSVRGGERFVLGETSFLVLDVRDDLTPPGNRPVEEMTFEPRDLQQVRYRDPDRRLDVLSHLPEVISGARTENELNHRLANLVLTGVAQAEAVAIVELDGAGTTRIRHWDRRRETAGEFRPSGRLVRDALAERRRSVLHVWPGQAAARPLYTEIAEFDWAFCTPVLKPGEAPWGLYVAGRLDTAPGDGSPAADGAQLKADVKFTELVAEIISAVQRLNDVERKLSVFRQFLAPPILAAVGDNLDLLEPRECDVTVLFCDLRGFSQQAEESAGDLLGLLDRVSRALGVMTHHILERGGVTGDFQGDAALGFWGWPFASDEAPLNACRAALGIRAAFEETHRRKDHPLANFQMGIGIAHGRAVAGKIGTSEQVKITVFGPVVNLASRLESMTKQLRVPIVLDETTAEVVRARLDHSEGRTRRLARVLPYGLEKPLVVSELLPSESECPELTDGHLERYEQGVEHFTAGRWEESYRCLHAMPASDRAQDFLGMLIAQHNRVAPSSWDGIVRLPSK